MRSGTTIAQLIFQTEFPLILKASKVIFSIIEIQYSHR